MKKLIVFILFLFCTSAFGADHKIYIDSSSDPAGDGSIETPYDELNEITAGDWTALAAASAASDAAEIILKRGSTFSTILSFGGADFSATAGNPIIIHDYGTGVLPIITHPTATLLRMDGNDNFTLRNLIVDGQGTATIAGIQTPGSGDPSHNLTLDNVTVQNYVGYGGFIESDNILVNNCDFNNCDSGGLWIHNSASPIVQYSKFYGNGLSGTENIDGLAVANGCSDFQILHNVSYNNKSDRGSGIDASANPGENITGVVKWNTTYGNEGKGLSCSGNDKVADEVTFFGNVSYDNGTYNFIAYEKITAYAYQNYFGSADNQSVQFGLNEVAEEDDVICTFKNNIVSGTYHHAIEIKHVGRVALTSDYNVMDGGTTSFAEYGEGVAQTFAEWQTSTSGDANSINEDPLVTSGGKLYINSPAYPGVVITGINDGGELDIWGNATPNPPYIGAYQGNGMRRILLNIGGNGIGFITNGIRVGE